MFVSGGHSTNLNINRKLSARLHKHAVSGSFFMGTIKLNELKKQYEFVCNEYVTKFCNKQEMDFEGWVGDTIGGIAYCNDFYFNFQDIVWDINSKQPKGAIVDWYYENLEKPEKSINYFSYTKGLRVSELK